MVVYPYTYPYIFRQKKNALLTICKFVLNLIELFNHNLHSPDNYYNIIVTSCIGCIFHI